jgi:hypothetical protein
MKLEDSRQFFEKSSNIKYHKNTFSGSRVVPRGRTDGQTCRSLSFFAILRTRLKRVVTKQSEPGTWKSKWSGGRYGQQAEPKTNKMKDDSDEQLFFLPTPPHVPYGLRGLPSRLWLKCNWLLRLGRPSGAVTLSRCGRWWYTNMKYQEGP